jgi:hypothetical protein
MVVAAFTVAGCSVGAEDPAGPLGQGEVLTTSYDGTNVVGQRYEDGSIRVEPLDAQGRALMALTLRGSHLEIEPLADQTLARQTVDLSSPSATSYGLKEWNTIAYGYSKKFAKQSEGGVSTKQMSAGRNGDMCIAAGSTLAECWYYHFCNGFCPWY